MPYSLVERSLFSAANSNNYFRKGTKATINLTTKASIKHMAHLLKRNGQRASKVETALATQQNQIQPVAGPTNNQNYYQNQTNFTHTKTKYEPRLSWPGSSGHSKKGDETMANV